MSEYQIDFKRRRFLTVATSVVGLAGAAFSVVPFIAMLGPSEQVKAEGGPVEVDISRLEIGQLIRMLWRKKPVWIFRRDKEGIKNLTTLESQLADPKSNVSSQQPSYTKNVTRSIRPEIGVIIGICTHLGCSPTYRPEVAPADLGKKWKGGFYCPCHGSRFDLAGRVYKGVPAPTNLVIPPYSFLSDNLIRIGSNLSA